jgi:hypothetical protein
MDAWFELRFLSSGFAAKTHQDVLSSQHNLIRIKRERGNLCQIGGATEDFIMLYGDSSLGRTTSGNIGKGRLWNYVNLLKPYVGDNYYDGRG